MSRDEPRTDPPSAAEQAAAEVLGAALDGGAPDAADGRALETAAFLREYGEHGDYDFALGDDRFDAVRHRLGAELDGPAPRRRWRWLFVAAPAVAALGLAVVVMPSLMFSAHEPAPAFMAAEAPEPAVQSPAPSPATSPAAVVPASAALLALQARIIEGDAPAQQAAYTAALAEYRARMLAAMRAER